MGMDAFWVFDSKILLGREKKDDLGFEIVESMVVNFVWGWIDFVLVVVRVIASVVVVVVVFLVDIVIEQMILL